MASFEWQDLRVSVDADGRATVVWPAEASALTAAELVSLGEALAAVGRLSGGEPDRADTAALLAKVQPNKAQAGVTRRPSRRLSEGVPPRIVPQASPSVDSDGNVQRKRAPKGQLLREIQGWLKERGQPASLQQLVQAAEEGGWSEAQNVEPSLVAVLRRHSEVFMRTPDGSFALRSSRTPGRVVRRRSVRQRVDSD